MNNFKKSVLSISFVSQIFAIGGFGFYGNVDQFSVIPETTTSGNISVVPESLDGGAGFGIFLYLDIIPVVDLQADFEFVGNLYKFNSIVGDNSSGMDFPWGRVSQYYTVRKELIGASVPFLAKVQIYAGGGFNSHKSIPVVSVKFIEDAFKSMSLEDAASQDFSDSDITEVLEDFIKENQLSSSGLHLQVGAQAKLLAFNVFTNLRYTIAEDVVPGKKGYPSIWIGGAIGI